MRDKDCEVCGIGLRRKDRNKRRFCSKRCMGISQSHAAALRKQQEKCSVSGCLNGAPLVKGTCRTHYYRFKSTGKYDLTNIRNVICSVDACGNKASRKTLCAKHYQRKFRTGSVDLRQPQINRYTGKPTIIKECMINGCDRKRHAYGYCQSHAYKFKRYGNPIASHERFKVNGIRKQIRRCLVCSNLIPDTFGSIVVCSDRCLHLRRKNKSPIRTCSMCGVKFESKDGKLSCSDICAQNRLLVARRKWHETQRDNNHAYQQRRRMAQQRRRAKTAALPVEKFSFNQLVDRDGWRCAICGGELDRYKKNPDPLAATIDHIRPISKGGAHIFSNVQLAHRICNARKSDKIDNEIIDSNVWKPNSIMHVSGLHDAREGRAV